MEHVEHLSIFGRTYLWDYRIRDLSFEEFLWYSSCFKTVNEEAFACVRILFYLNFLNIVLSFEILNWEGFNEM